MIRLLSWSRGLRGRLVLAVAGVHALLMSLFVWDVTWRQHTLLLEQQANTAEAVARAMATSSSGWLSARDFSGLQEIVNAQRHYPDLAYAMLLDETGRVLAHTDRNRLGSFVRGMPSTGDGPLIRRDARVIDVVVPAQNGGHRVGWARVGFWTGALTARMAAITRAGMLYALAAILAGVVMAFLLATGVTARLYAIRRVSSAVRSGTPGERVPRLGDDEVARLGQDFNGMLDALDEREALRREAELALRESERLSRATFELASVGIAHLDPQGRWLRVNPRLAAMLGYTPAGMVSGLRFQDITHPDDLEGDLEQVRRCLSGETDTFTREKRYLTPKGEEVWVNLSVALVRCADGAPDYFITVVEEIGARKRAQQALRESEQRVRLLLDSTAEGLFGLDSGRRCIFINRAGLRMLGYERDEELLGHDLHALVHPPAPDREPCEVPRCKLLAAPGSPSGLHAEQESFRRRDGSAFPVEMSIYPMHRGGRAVGVVVTFADITDAQRERAERESLEAQLRQSQKMEAVGRLAGGVAHDFNNILTVILGNASMIRGEDPLSTRQGEWLDQIEEAGKRASGLTQRLLTFSRRQRFECRDVDLNRVVYGIQGMLGRMLGEDVVFEVSLAPEPLPLWADAGMLEQVLLNLAVNARDALGPGGRFVVSTRAVDVGLDAARSRRGARPGPAVVLTVADTGSGIPPAILQRIFEPFFTTKDVGRGTGLGLSIVHGIVEQHRGWIEVDSEPGRGTTFRVFFPRGTGPLEDARPGDAAAGPARGHEGILLAEDEPAVRRLAREALERGGYRVFEAEDGPAALRVWREHRDEIRLAVLDMVMPGGLSGRQLAERLHQDAPGIPVVLCSGYSPENPGDERAQDEKTAFVGKPYELDRFLGVVRRMIDD